MLMRSKGGIAAACVLAFLSCAAVTHAATLLFSQPVPASAGKAFPVDVMLDPAGATINTLGVTVNLPQGVSYSSSSDAGSILAYWVERPTVSADGRSVTFSGIIPGGFSGVIDPFDAKDRKPGQVAELLLAAPAAGTYALATSDLQAYLDDGQGTATPLSAAAFSVTVGSAQPGAVLSTIDTQPPLAFLPHIVQDPLLYEGKYALVFSTEDTGSGIDHYEVQEGSGPWLPAQSPYLLHDQTLSGPVRVRAVDRSGNVTTESAPIPAPSPASPSVAARLAIVRALERYLLPLLAIVVVALYALAVLAHRRSLRRKERNKRP